MFLEWKPAAGADAAAGDDVSSAAVNEMSAVNSHRDTDWTVVVSDSTAAAAVSYSSEHRHATQPS